MEELVSPEIASSFKPLGFGWVLSSLNYDIIANLITTLDIVTFGASSKSASLREYDQECISINPHIRALCLFFIFLIFFFFFIIPNIQHLCLCCFLFGGVVCVSCGYAVSYTHTCSLSFSLVFLRRCTIA